MSESESRLADSPHQRRYLRILRDTIRRELESRVEDHLVEGDNLKHYLSELGIESNIPLREDSLYRAEKAVESCRQISDWFDLREFWKEIGPAYQTLRGPTAYQKVLTKLLVRLHGFWVFTLDDTSHTFSFIPTPHEKDEWGRSIASSNNDEECQNVRIHLGDGVYYRDDEGPRNVLDAALKHYLLRPGEGSVGLGLRADRGVCLRDTVRDLRGAVAIEDCFTRNLSYIGLPVFLKQGSSDPDRLDDLGERGRPIGHFGVFFPAPLGWHQPLGSSDDWCKNCTFSSGCPPKPVCLYQRMWDLRKKVVQPLVAQNYENASNDRYKASVGRIADLGEDARFQNRGVEPQERRRVFLEKLLPTFKSAANGKIPTASEAGSSGSPGSTTLKIEEFQAVQIWERHAAIAGLSHGLIAASEAGKTWRQSLRWNFKDLFRAQLRHTLTNFELKSDDETIGPWVDKQNGPWHALKYDRFPIESPDEKPRFHLTSRRLGDEHQIILVRDKDHEGEPDLLAASDFWRECLDVVTEVEPPQTMPEFRERMKAARIRVDEINNSDARNRELDRVVCRLKWRRMLRSHLAQCLVMHLVPGEQNETQAGIPQSKKVATPQISDFLFSDDKLRKNLQERLDKLKPLEGTLSAAILGGSDYRLKPNSIVCGSALQPLCGDPNKPSSDRLRFELQNVSHTLSVILALAHVAAETGMMKDGKVARFRTNHTQEPGHGNKHDWPIQSEAYRDSKQGESSESHIDCGTETAFSIPAIWESWWEEFAKISDGDHPPELDMIELKEKADIPGEIEVTLRNAHQASTEAMLQFSLIDNRKAMAFHRVLAFTSERLIDETRHLWDSDDQPQNYRSRLWCETDDNDGPIAMAASQVASFVTSWANSGSYLVVAKVAGRTMIQRRCFADETAVSVADEEAIDAFESIIESAGEDGHFLGPAFGLTTHVVVPLRRSVEAGQDPDVGFIILSGSQIEHDTIRRVDIRPAQRAIAQFAADYLEYAISQELQTADMRESLQGFAHSLRRRGRFMRSGPLADFPNTIFPRHAELMGFTGDNRVGEMLSSLYDRPPDHKFIDYVAGLLEGSKNYEQLRSVSLDFNIMVKALTFVLADEHERPATTEDYPTCKQLGSLGDWIQHIAQEAVRYQKSNRNEILLESEILQDMPLEYGPLGSWLVILEEVIRNSAKYGSGERPRSVHLCVNSEEVVVRSSNKRLPPDQLTKVKKDSTQAGLRDVRRLLRVNYGRENEGWTLSSNESDPETFNLEITAKHKSYVKICERP